MTIRRVLIGALVALLLLAITVLLTLFYRHASFAVEAEARNAITAAITDAKRRTVAFLAPAGNAIATTRALIDKKIVDPADEAELLALLQEFLLRDPQLAAIYVGATNGDFTFIARNPATGGYVSKVIRGTGPGRRVHVVQYDADYRLVAEVDDSNDAYDPRARPWFTPAIESGSVVWSAPYRFYTTGLDGVTASRSLPRTGRFPGGVIGVDVGLGALNGFLAELPLGANNKAAFFAGDGSVIAAPGLKLITGAAVQPDPMISALLGAVDRPAEDGVQGDVQLRRFRYQNAPHLGGVSDLPAAAPPWTLAAAVPRASYFGWFDALRTHVAAFALIAILVGLAGAGAIASRLARPFERLAANATALGQGSYGSLSPPSSRIVEARATEQAFADAARALRERDEDNQDMLYALRRFSEAVGQSPIAIFFTEPDGKLSYANEAFTRLTGFELIDVMNEPPVAFWRAPDAGPSYSGILGTVSRGMVWQGEIESRSKDGRLFDAELTVAPVRTASGRIAGCASILEDITERKRTRAALEATVEEATRLARARSVFLANMSHEIRTPLNAIIGFAETMEAEVFGPLGNPRYREYARDIRQSGQHLLSVLIDVLDAATLEAARIELREEEVVLADLVQTAIRMVENAVNAHRHSITATLDGSVIVRADPVRLRQVVLNILSNAVKYTPDGGRIDVAVRANDRGAEILVHDSGIGINTENLDWVMKPFARETDDAFVAEKPGVGLGLPIAKSLMDLHGGALTLTSARNRGTLVTLRLPPERLIRAA